MLLIGAPYVHAAIVALTSRNSGSVRTRTVATAVYNMPVQVSTIIGNNVSVSPPLSVYLSVRLDWLLTVAW